MSDAPLIIGNEFVSQVRSFGALGYSFQRICDLLQLDKRQQEALALRLSRPDDEYFLAYRNGCAIGEYNIDAELAKKAEIGDIDAVNILESRKCARLELDLRKKLFGI